MCGRGGVVGYARDGKRLADEGNMRRLAISIDWMGAPLFDRPVASSSTCAVRRERVRWAAGDAMASFVSSVTDELSKAVTYQYIRAGAAPPPKFGNRKESKGRTNRFQQCISNFFVKTLLFRLTFLLFIQHSNIPVY